MHMCSMLEFRSAVLQPASSTAILRAACLPPLICMKCKLKCRHLWHRGQQTLAGFEHLAQERTLRPPLIFRGLTCPPQQCSDSTDVASRQREERETLRVSHKPFIAELFMREYPYNTLILVKGGRGVRGRGLRDSSGGAWSRQRLTLRAGSGAWSVFGVH